MESLNTLINGEKPVLVNFHTQWSDPCKMMGPVMDQLNAEQQTNAHVVKVDIDQHRTLSQQFGIQSASTFILFKKGEIIWRRSGVVDKATLVREITKSVG